MPNSTPPPLPTPSGRPIAAGPPAEGGPSPLAEKLRELGMLPPLNLKGEYALGAWWTGRIGGVLALAAVIFYGVWLNATQHFPAWFMVSEIAAIGIAIFWFSLRLSLRNQDLGRVIGAAGFGVLQFDAWATYGLKSFNLFGSSILGSSLLQFVTAIGVVVIALWRQDKLFAQLAVVFAGLAVFFAIQNPDSEVKIDDYVNVLGIAMVALIGVVLMLRGSWGSVGWLGLLISQLCLVYWQFSTSPGSYLSSYPIEWAALFSFTVLWVGGRLLNNSEILGDIRSHDTFQLCSFFAPAAIAFAACNPAHHGRTDLALAVAVLALVLGLMERVRSTNVSQIMLISALVFAAAGVAARLTTDQWIPWLLVAALAQLLASRMKSRLGRSATEVLSAVAAYYLIFGPHDLSSQIPWGSMVGIAGMATLISFREDLEQADEWQYLLRMCGLVVLGTVLVGVQQWQATPEMTGWPWLAVGLVAMVRYRKGLIWAALPAYVVSCYHVLAWISATSPATASNGWHPFWILVIGLTLAGVIWRTAERKEEWIHALHHALLFSMAFLMAWAAWFFGLWAHTPAFPSQVSLWFGGALLVSAVTGGLRLTAFPANKLVLALPGFLAGYIVILATDWGFPPFLNHPVNVVDGLLWLIGVGLLLGMLIKHTEAYADSLGESMQRTIFGILLMGHTFLVAANMDKLNVVPSVVWALASVLIFLTGYLWISKSFRMIGLVALAITTWRIFTHDLVDAMSRVIACGVIAMAFLGVAWLYGRMNPDKKIPQT